jgi:hypothetical protein
VEPFWHGKPHYNGQSELSKRAAMAKVKTKNLFYKNEQSLMFEKVIEILSKSFSILDKDLDERLSEHQKVEKLLSCIQTQDLEMVAQKSIIASYNPNDFLGACNYFSAQVSHLHASAQLVNSKYTNNKKHLCNARSWRQKGWWSWQRSRSFWRLKWTRQLR